MEAAPNPFDDIPLVEPAARGLIGYEVLIRQELPERRIHPEHPGVLVRPQAGRAHYGWDSVQKLADPLLGIGLILLQDALDSRWRCQFHQLGQVIGVFIPPQPPHVRPPPLLILGLSVFLSPALFRFLS